MLEDSKCSCESRTAFTPAFSRAAGLKCAGIAKMMA